MRLYVVVVLLCTTYFGLSNGYRNISIHNKYLTVRQLTALILDLYANADSRTGQVLKERVKYENTEDFETGYVMGEIIERYRMFVSYIKAAHKHKNMILFDMIIRLEFMQKIYFEVYHLVMMMHEIPRKYGERISVELSESPLAMGVEEAPNTANDSLVEALQDMPYVEQAQEHKNRENLKKIQQQRQEFLLYGVTHSSTAKKRSHSWPIEYGWSIEDDW